MERKIIFISTQRCIFFGYQNAKVSQTGYPNRLLRRFRYRPEGYLYLSGMFNLVCMHLDKLEASYIPLTQKGYNAKITRILATNNGAYISTLGGGLFSMTRKHIRQPITQQKSISFPATLLQCLFITQWEHTDNQRQRSDKLFSRKNSFTTINLMRNFPTAHIISGCGIFASDQKRIYVGDTKG